MISHWRENSWQLYSVIRLHAESSRNQKHYSSSLVLPAVTESNFLSGSSSSVNRKYRLVSLALSRRTQPKANSFHDHLDEHRMRMQLSHWAVTILRRMNLKRILRVCLPTSICSCSHNHLAVRSPNTSPKLCGTKPGEWLDGHLYDMPWSWQQQQ